MRVFLIIITDASTVVNDANAISSQKDNGGRAIDPSEGR